MANDGDRRPPDDDNGKEDEDFYDIFIRVTGWLYLATGAGMLGFFLWWLKSQ